MARVNSNGLEHDFPCRELLVALTFAAALGMLAISLFWPYMIPFAITNERVTASHSSLTFIFSGASAFVLPFMLLRTAINYAVFRGKVALSGNRVEPMRDNFRCHRTDRRGRGEVSRVMQDEVVDLVLSNLWR